MADSSVVLKPNAATFYNAADWTCVPSVSYTILADDNDQTYAQHNELSNLPYIDIDFDTYTFPANTTIKSVYMRFRASSLGDAYATQYSMQVVGGPTTTFLVAAGTQWYGATVLLNPTQADINSLRMFLSVNGTIVGTGFNIKFYEVEATVYYNTAPTVVPDTPSILTSKPAISWTYSDTDNDPQERYQVKIFSDVQYGDANFNPDTSTTTWSSGEVLSSATSAAPTTALVNATTYRVYVKAADAGQGGRYGLWAYVQWTTGFVTPATPTISASADNANAHVTLTVTGFDNLLTANISSIEDGITGWFNNSNCALAQSSAQASHGTYSLRLTSSASGDMSAATTTASGVTVAGSTTCTALASFRSAVSARSCRVKIAWYDSTSTIISTSTGGNVADSTSAWTQATVTASSPSNAAYATIIVEVVATGAGSEVHYVDKISLAPGSSTTWTYGGFTPTLIDAEYTDDATTWYPVRAATAATFSSAATQTGTLYDYEAPSGTARTYRVRITDAADTVTSAASSTSAATQTLTGWWLKDPLYPTLNTAVSLRQDELSLEVPQTSKTVEPLGRTRKLVLLGDVRGAEFKATLLAASASAKATLESMRDNSRTLLLQSPYGDQWYVRVAKWAPKRLNTASVTWLIDAELVEVDNPSDTIQNVLTA